MDGHIPSEPGRLTWGGGLPGVDLLPMVYDQLRAIAHQRLAEERAGHTLQATALVHEAYLRLTRDPRINWQNRAHFFHAAAEAMRLILIEHARRRNRLKRGGNRRRVPLSVAELADDCDSSQIMAVDDGLRRLEEQHATSAQVVRLRFFAGLSVEQTAEVMSISARTVNRHWTFARAWLFRAVEQSDAD